MKKTLLIVLALYGLTSNAQTTVYSEDFPVLTNLSALGWTLYNDTNTPFGSYQATFLNESWGVINWTEEGTNNVASSTSWFTNVAPADRWMITPSINLTPYFGQSVSLSFKVRAHDTPPFADNFDLKVSTTTTDKASFTNIYTSTLNPNTVIADTAPTTIDLTSYTGEIVYLAWVNNFTNGNLLSIDNIVVTANNLATDSFSSNQFSVSPNPVKNQLSISNKNNSVVTNYILTDSNGRTIKENDISINSNFTINVSDLSAGIYFLKLNSQNGATIKKFIKN